MAELQLIRGAGGGGGGSSEASDTVAASQLFDVIDLISEGECEGLVNGLQSIYYEGVPLQAADGSMNFTDVTVQTTPGTQGQAAISGVDGVQNEVPVGTTVLFASPITRTILNPSVDTCRVTILIPQLSETDTDTGDVGGSSFTWAIELQSAGGGYVEVARETVNAKTMSRYPRATKFPLKGSAPWNVRVRRLTADSTSSAVVNAFAWSSYTEIQTVKLRYPNSHLIRTTGNGKYFSSVPVRSFDWLGLRVQVPSNYSPLTRVYTGVWDGTWKLAWTDNPAWIYRDVIVSNRYGLGRFFSVTDAFKWELYAIARYCDELVPDGYGGMEPRFRCSPQLEERKQAYEVLVTLASIFRGIVYWLNRDVSVSQDAPSDPVAHFTEANVAGEPGQRFNYTGSSNAKRYSSVIVWWNDITQQGKLVPEVHVDPDLEAELGVKSLELTAIGVWSRGQALRVAKWALYTQEQETEAVAFKVGLDGVLVQPGQIFQISDPHEAGGRMAGRVSAATASQVTLDADVTLDAGAVYTLTVMLQDPVDLTRLMRQERAVVTGAGASRTLSVSPAFTAAPAREAVWLLQSDQLAATMWRCTGVAEVKGENAFTITGVAHQPKKYDLIEKGIAFQKAPVSKILLTPPKPTDLVITESPYLSGSIAKSRVTVSWAAKLAGLDYLVRWRLNAGPWTDMASTSENSVELDGLAKGLFEAGVRSRNALSNVSPELAGARELLGWTTKPSNVTGATATVVQGGVLVRWDSDQADNYLASTVKIGAGILFEGSASSWLWPWPAFGTYDLTITHWDTSLNESAVPTPVHVVVDAAVLTQWQSLGNVPANVAALLGTEAIKNSDIHVGGVNLVHDSNNFLAPWNYSNGRWGPGQLADPFGGNRATRLTLFSNPWDLYLGMRGLRVGATYTASIWVFLETATNFVLTLNNSFAWNTGPAVAVTGSGWQRAIATITTDTGAINIHLGAHSNTGTAQQTPGTVRVSMVQLEEGNAATQWARAPEDVAADIDAARTAANSAADAASAASASAAAALAQIDIVRSDGWLSRGEKPGEILRWNVLGTAQASNVALADNYGVSHVAFDAAMAALKNYLGSLTPGWGDLSADTPINGNDYRTAWQNALVAQQALLDAISAQAKARLGALATLNQVGTAQIVLYAVNGKATFSDADGVTFTNAI